MAATASAARSIAQSWLTVFKAAQKLQLSPEHVLVDLTQLGLSSDRATFIAKAYRKNSAAFQRTVVGVCTGPWRRLSVAGRSLNINQLADMEWRFGGAVVWRGACVMRACSVGWQQRGAQRRQHVSPAQADR